MGIGEWRNKELSMQKFGYLNIYPYFCKRNNYQ